MPTHRTPPGKGASTSSQVQGSNVKKGDLEAAASARGFHGGESSAISTKLDQKGKSQSAEPELPAACQAAKGGGGWRPRGIEKAPGKMPP